MKIDQNTENEKIFALLDEVESDLEDDLDELMNDSDTEFVFEQEDPEKDDSFDDRPKNILIPEANIHFIEDQEKNLENSKEESQEDRVSAPAAKEKPKGQSKEKKKGKGEEKTKKVKIPLNWKKRVSPHPKQQCNLSAEVTHSFPDNHTPFDVFSVVTNLNILLELLVDQSNLYAQQNGREFKTNIDEMKAFLGINYFMTINKLPTIKSYWECGEYVGNPGIRNVMARTRFEQILRNLHFADNQKDEKIDKAYKVRSIIKHLNDSFSSCVSNDSTQSVDEHMVKFRGRSSMRQYLKNKPIKWGFKFWYRCASKTGYLYQFDLYLGKKESREENLGRSVVLALTECLKNTYGTIFFDNFFNSPSLIIKLFEKGLYGIGTTRVNRKGIPKMKPDKEMKRGDHEYQFTDKVACCKWFDRRSVTMLFSNIPGMQSTSTV